MKYAKTKNLIKRHWKLILVIIYVISPIDLIPDVLFPLGYTEDILLVVSMVLDYFLRKRAEKPFKFDAQNKQTDE